LLQTLTETPGFSCSREAQTRSLIWRGSWVIKPSHVLSLFCFREHVQISLKIISSPSPVWSRRGALAEPCRSRRQESCSPAGSSPGVPRGGLALFLCLLRVSALLAWLLVLSLGFPVSRCCQKDKHIRHLGVACDAKEMGQNPL